ncbi:hypothetical protein RFC90_002741 [Klebsiella aerogenes]|nr:hypothetical protein [Klebsiella aerogenes]
MSLGFVNIQRIATIIADFNFTILVFFSNYRCIYVFITKICFFGRWINDGGADAFFVPYNATIVCLFITFSLGLIVFNNVGAALAFKLMLMFAIDNIIQTMILALVISGKVVLDKKDN